MRSSALQTVSNFVQPRVIVLGVAVFRVDLGAWEERLQENEGLSCPPFGAHFWPATFSWRLF